MTRWENEEWLAGRDHLTGLCDLHCFADLARERLMTVDAARAEATEIVFVNLHHFKRYNLRYGYEEGDQALRRFADALQDNESIELVGRVAEDHFLFLARGGLVMEILQELHQDLQIIAPDGMLRICAGIYNLKPGESIIAAADKAKAAANSVRRNHHGEFFWRYYDHSLELEIERCAYIVENIDRAIEYGWIHVYYQPVMRTLTGRLCGMEALARWEDPVYGLLSPGIFIPVLEENLLIHRLDLCMLRMVCEDYRRETDEGRSFVPVSFNLSRLDFDLCDILKEVEQLVSEYHVPKNILHIEITESVLSDNSRRVRETLKGFHEAGYQVWMDDFGSGYSSLNVLKDYDFDTLKIDMRFLSDSGEHAHSIVTSVVDMAKKIGIQTLAEGVETQEQLDFLRSIGCEKVQGYYYGRPELFSRGVQQTLAKETSIEDEQLGQYYDQIGQVNLIDDRPIALAEYENGQIHVLYMNAKLAEELKGAHINSRELLNKVCNTPTFAVYEVVHQAAERIRMGSGIQTIRFVAEGRYFLMQACCVGELETKKMFQVNIVNMTDDIEWQHQRYMDEAIRSLYLTCDNVYINNMEDGTVQSLMDHEEDPDAPENWLLQMDPAGFAGARIHPEDQGRYLAFTDLSTLYERLQKSPRGFIAGYFRTKCHNGDYEWKRHIFVLISKLGPRRFVSASQPVNEAELMELCRELKMGSE